MSNLKKYLIVKPIVIEGMPDAHTANFKVDSQSFCIGQGETKKDAEWFCEMFMKAMVKVMSKEGFDDNQT